jgi:protoheme IX farnesyltransferase
LNPAAVLHRAHPPVTLGALAELTKVRISAMSTLTGAAGYVAFARGLHWGVVAASLGTVLLAMGASALNEVQERDYDAVMLRTRNRPIPTGAVSPAAAAAVAFALGAAGFAVLYFGGNLTAALLGLLAMVWYNGIYTPLKRVTAFAAVPGSLIGALPPAIGWAAAGGNPLDPAILALCTVFFIWQVPHFWLLLFLYGEDYARAGFPTLDRVLSKPGLARLTFTWMAATAASCTLLPAFGAVRSLPSFFLLAASALWLIWKSLPVLGPAPSYRRAFLHINLFALFLVLSTLLDPFFVR